MPARKLPEDYHKLAESKGIKWLGPDVSYAQTKTQWRCSKGHKWETCYSDIRRDHGCPHCYGNAPKIKQDYYSLAEKRNFEWIGKELPKCVVTKTLWRCQERHEWEARYNDIRQGNGCPYCANRVPKTEQDYRDLARWHDIGWIGKELPKNTHTKTFWRCLEGHKWEAQYGTIQQGHGCPYCYGNIPKTEQGYYNLAKGCSIEWIGKEFPPNTGTKTLWQCLKRHKWEASYNTIQQGHGCPCCLDMVNGHQVSKPQRQICKMLDGELNYPFGHYRIDAALPDEKIAVEYDCWFWHGHKLEEDAERDTDLLAADWKVLHVKSNLKIPSRRRLIEAIDKLRNGKKRVEIVLDDWGEGRTFADARERKRQSVPIKQNGDRVATGCQQLRLW